MRALYFKLLMLILPVLLCFYGCNNSKTQGEITKVDDLIDVVDSLKNVYNNLDFKQLHKDKKVIDKNFNYVRTHLSEVNMQDTAILKVVGAYAALAKITSRIYKHGVDRIGVSLDESEQKLNDLRYDIKHQNIVNEDSMGIYLKTEADIIYQLNERILKANDDFELIQNNFATLNPLMENILEEMKPNKK